MAELQEFERKVVRTEIRDEEKSTFRGRSFSWRCTSIYTLTAECGHTRVVRASGKVVKIFRPCQDCKAGKPTQPVTPGLFDSRDGKIKDPLAAALVPGGAS